MVDFGTGEERCEHALGGWRHRMLRRSGLCDELADRLALTGEIDVEKLYALVQRGCDPLTAVRILAPDEWTPTLSSCQQVEWKT